MPRRNLLLCFDAFGTLFRPKRPIEQQYGDVARQCLAELAPPGGSSGSALLADDGAIRASFRAAFRAQAQRHPNYGRASRLGAEQWWTNVIHDTFAPLLAPAGMAVPPALAPRLLHRFASRDGYAMAPRLPALLRALKAQPPTRRRRRQRFDQIVVGVITNSDDRVPAILASFGLRVAPLRHGGPVPGVRNDHGAPPPAYDIDFHCMSYDVGVEKPDARIFRAAEALLAEVLRRHAAPGTEEAALADWDKMYVGDDVAKDVVGALNAGWLPVLVADGDGGDQAQAPAPTAAGVRLLAALDDADDGQQPLAALLAPRGDVAALQVASVEALVEWLAGDAEEGAE